MLKGIVAVLPTVTGNCSLLFEEERRKLTKKWTCMTYRVTNILREIYKSASNKEIFAMPMRLTISSCGWLLHVIDDKIGSLTLTTKGEVVWSFKDSDRKCQSGVCICVNDSLIMCGYYSNNVCFVDKNERKKKVLPSKVDGTNCPKSVSDLL